MFSLSAYNTARVKNIVQSMQQTFSKQIKESYKNPCREQIPDRLAIFTVYLRANIYSQPAYNNYSI